jgi:hypothetical protein
MTVSCNTIESGKRHFQQKDIPTLANNPGEEDVSLAEASKESVVLVLSEAVHESRLFAWHPESACLE